MIKLPDYGSKPIIDDTKCSYNSCFNRAISYTWTPRSGLALCENHGGTINYTYDINNNLIK